jgi:hypothetical protein
MLDQVAGLAVVAADCCDAKSARACAPERGGERRGTARRHGSTPRDGGGACAAARASQSGASLSGGDPMIRRC